MGVQGHNDELLLLQEQLKKKQSLWPLLNSVRAEVGRSVILCVLFASHSTSNGSPF